MDQRLVKLHSRNLNATLIRTLISDGFTPVFSSKANDLEVTISRLKDLLDMDLYATSISTPNAFEIRNGKVYLHIFDINTFEAARLLTAVDKHKLAVQNYNVDSIHENQLLKLLKKAADEL